MKKAWGRFEQFLKKEGVQMEELGFRRGNNEASISKVETHLGKPFPEDYRNFLLICDGQKDRTFDWLPDHMTLFGLEEILKSWDYQLSIMPMVGELAFNTYQFHDKIRSLVFHREWIPIAEFEEGTCCIYLDYIPGPKGTEGQLIFNTTEADFIVLAETLSEFVGKYVEFLEEGELRFKKHAKSQESKFAILTSSGKTINGDIWLKMLAD